jgi:hypothetical protein
MGLVFAAMAVLIAFLVIKTKPQAKQPAEASAPALAHPAAPAA